MLKIMNPCIVSVILVLSITFLFGETESSDSTQPLRPNTQATHTGDNLLRSDMVPQEIINFYQSPKNDKSVRQNLASFITTSYISQPGLLNVIPPSELIELTNIVQLEKNSVHEFATVLAEAVKNGQLRIWRFDPTQLHFIAEFLKNNGNQQICKTIVANWLGMGSTNLSGVNPEIFQVIENSLLIGNPAPAGTGEIFKKLSDERKLSLNDYAMGVQYLSRLCATMANARDIKRAVTQTQINQQLADAAVDKFLAIPQNKLTLDDWSSLAWVLPAASKKTPDSKVMGIIKSLQQWQNDSTAISEESYMRIGIFFAKNKQWVELLEKQIQTGNQPDLVVVKVLSWASRTTKSIRKFASQLEARIAKEKYDGDLLAKWYLAAAYANSLTNESFVRRTDGLYCLKQALAAAKSQPVKYQCLIEMISCCSDYKLYGYPVQIIASMQKQFSSPYSSELGKIAERLKAKDLTRQTELKQFKQDKANRNYWAGRINAYMNQKDNL